jgi:hypothetical protein
VGILKDLGRGDLQTPSVITLYLIGDCDALFNQAWSLLHNTWHNIFNIHIDYIYHNEMITLVYSRLNRREIRSLYGWEF